MSIKSNIRLGHDTVEKIIAWILCKKFKFDNIPKWYMHKEESILENETHKRKRKGERGKEKEIIYTKKGERKKGERLM